MEKTTKRLITTCFVLSIIVLVLSVFELASDVYMMEKTNIVFDSIDLALDIFILVCFAICNGKTMSELVQKKKLVLIASIVSIFASSLIVMICAMIAHNQINKFEVDQSTKDNKNEVEKAVDFVYPAEELIAKLKTLQTMKEGGEIGEEEYELARQQLLDNFRENQETEEK